MFSLQFDSFDSATTYLINKQNVLQGSQVNCSSTRSEHIPICLIYKNTTQNLNMPSWSYPVHFGFRFHDQYGPGYDRE